MPRSDFLLVETPPNYQRTVAVNDKFCWLCINYVDSYCKMYEIPVQFNFTCDSWKRNWNVH